jgi:hypothetical protein
MQLHRTIRRRGDPKGPGECVGDFDLTTIWAVAIDDGQLSDGPGTEAGANSRSKLHHLTVGAAESESPPRVQLGSQRSILDLEGPGATPENSVVVHGSLSFRQFLVGHTDSFQYPLRFLSRRLISIYAIQNISKLDEKLIL